jgi:hypothetical protein
VADDFGNVGLLATKVWSSRLPTSISRDANLRWREPRSLDVSEREVQRLSMSSADIIREIGALPLEEQLKVIAFGTHEAP